MNKRTLAACLIAAISMVVASCRETLAPTDVGPASSVEEPRPRQTLSGAWAPEPGSCTATFTATGDGFANAPTNCYLEPQSVSSITITGTLTASPSPQSTCCIVTTYPESGTYGPMGGPPPHTWMQLLVRLRLVQANTQSATIVMGSPIGSAANSVTINDVYVTGGLGRFVMFERTAMGKGVACGGNPPAPPCPYSGYTAAKYVVSGTQTVTVRWMAKTLQLHVTPTSTLYEGDSVTFTARSSDTRPVTVSHWFWRDSTGTATPVPCGNSPVCRWVPPNTGIMYVRAKVGTNPFFEQASAYAELLPVEFAITLSPASVAFSDTVTVTPKLTPARPILSFEILAPVVAMGATGPLHSATARHSPKVQSSMTPTRAASPLLANSTTVQAELDNILCGGSPSPRCRGVAVSSGVVRARAIVNGRPRVATATLEVTPLYITVEGTGDASFVDSLELVGSAPPYQCPDMAGVLGYPLLDRAPEKEVTSLEHPLVPHVSIGRGLMKSYAPMEFKQLIVNASYGTGLPLALYLPATASLITTEFALPRGAGWTYVKSMSLGIEYQCKTWWAADMTLKGRLIFNGHMSLTFMAKGW
ncbi:hypothetical protein [Gemmatimonas sp.]|uniref:hypothetical protein n=1 Tax=Gemmatimonas sp. TaxID=1962908 RepID=UPI00333F5693